MSESRFADEGTLAYIAQLEAECGKVPDGWVMVPRIVTPAIEAVYSNDTGAYGTAQELHDAMIAAAPQPALKATPLDLMECLTDRPIEPSGAVKDKCVAAPKVEQQEPVAWRYKKPVCNEDGSLIGYSDWILTTTKDYMEWWPHDNLFLRYAAPPDLVAENERLRQVCRDTYEVWAGSEGAPLPKTCGEAYLLQMVEAMCDEVKKGLK